MSASNQRQGKRRVVSGHSLLELIFAMVASAVLLAGLGSVMLVARQVAYTPAASSRRLEASQVANQLADEVRDATFFIAHTAHAIEFVVADRNNDGTAERIRYEWSGTPGDPLNKTVNGGTAIAVLASVQNLQFNYVLNTTTTAVSPSTDSTEVLLASNTSSSGSNAITIGATTSLNFVAQGIPPVAASAPAGATSWNVTRVDFRGAQYNQPNANLHVQVHSCGDPADCPTGVVLGEVVIPESNITASTGWNTATFASPVRGLSIFRDYDIVWTGTAGETTSPLNMQYNNNAVGNVSVSSDIGASWQYNTFTDSGTVMTPIQVFYRVYGTFTSQGTTTNITRNYAKELSVLLQTSGATHSRVNVSVPLENTPELLSAYWRTDFDSNPTTLDCTRDGTLDWKTSNNSTFDTSTLVGGVWRANGTLQSQPVNNFTNVTTVEARCRNTSVGGNGAVVQIGADWAGGLHAPLFFRLQLQSDGTQMLTLYNKSNDTTNVSLFQRTRLPSGFQKVRMTILPTSNVVNLLINDEDQGTFTYTSYAPSADDRYVAMSNDVSNAEFDYVEVRVGEN